MFALRGFSSKYSVSMPTLSRRCLLFLTTLIVLVAGRQANAQSVSFNGLVRYIGSGFNLPEGVAVDGAGNVYIADSDNNAVHIYAPNGNTGYTYKGDVGTDLSLPKCVAVDASGNVYIGDYRNNRVLKETLVAGSYTQNVIATTSTDPIPSASDLIGPAAVAVDGSGNVYIANPGRNNVLKLSPSGGSYTQRVFVDDNTLGGATFNAPQGVAVDASAHNVYIADTDNGKVYLDSFTAGYGYSRNPIDTGPLGLSYPSSVAVDGNGNVYIADSAHNRVLKETRLPLLDHYTQSVLASGLNYPGGVAVDGAGNVYIADMFNNRVMKIAPDVDLGEVAVNATAATKQTLIYTFTAGGSGVTVAVLTKGAVGADFVDAGTGSCTTQGITKIYSTGDTCTVNIRFNPKFAGLREGAAVLTNSSGSTISTVYIHGIGVSSQVIFSPGTQSTIPLNVSNGAFGGAAVDGSGNVYVADNPNSAVHVYAPNGSGGGYTQKNDLVPSLGYRPYGVVVDGAGNVYIADGNNPGAVHKYSPNVSGDFTQQSDVAGGLARPDGVAVDSSGNIYVTDVVNSAVHVYAPDGSGGYNQRNDVGVSLGYQPTGVAVDGAGNVYVADGNRPGSVHKYSPNISGGFTQRSDVANGLAMPYGVAVDGVGNVYIADYYDNAIHMYSPDGSGGYALQSDLGASLVGISSVAVDAKGNVYATDNYTLTKFDLSTAPTLVFATPTQIGTVDTADAAQTVTLGNIGNRALTFAVNGGNNPSITADFGFAPANAISCPTLSSTSSPEALSVGATCIYGINFSPSKDGTIGGSAILTANNLNGNDAPVYAPLTIATMSGTGVGSGPVAKFVVSAPATMVSAQSYSVSITAEDKDDNTVSTYSGPVVLTSTYPKLVFANLTLNNGVGTLGGFHLETAGTGFTITATDANGITGTSGPITVTPGPAAYLGVTTPSSTLAGLHFNGTVRAYDQAGNVATDYVGPVGFRSSDARAVLPANVTPVNGAATFDATLVTLGSQTITAIDTLTASVAGTSNAISVAQANFAMTVPASTFTTGQFSGTVAAYDLAGNVATGYSGAVQITSSDPNATLPVNVTLTNGSATFTARLVTLGSQTLTADYASNATFTATNVIVVNLPNIVVTTTGDTTTGVPVNCMTTSTPCSLRDAVATANSLSGLTANISFALTPAPTVANPATITLGTGTNQGHLYLAQNMNIVGPGANVLSISGTNATQVFSVASSGTINDLTITGGNGSGIYNGGTLALNDVTVSNNTSSRNGGGIYNDGSLTLNNVTVSSNTAGNVGGGIFNAGNLMLNNDTIYNNTASEGGGIYSYGTATLNNNTVSNNSASYIGGGIANDTGGLTVNNSILSNNEAARGSNSDGGIIGGYSGSNNVFYDSTSPITEDPKLAPLGNYGGPTQTMLPLPGSAAICAGSQALITSGVKTDQRGAPNTNAHYPGYNSATPCVDAGAVQTAYTIGYVQQPTDVVAGSSFAPSVTAQMSESGLAFNSIIYPALTPANFTAIQLNVTPAAGTLNANTSAWPDPTTGLITFTGLGFIQATPSETGDSLTVAVGTVSATSATFNVTPMITTISAITPTSGVISGGTVVTITGTNFADATAVTFGAMPATTFTVVNTTTIVATSPVGLGGVVDVMITTPRGTSAHVAADQFTYNKNHAVVTLSSLNQTYTGSALSATAVTSPASLTLGITYNGSATVPTAAGSYAVIATIDDPNYQGSASGTLVIAKATPTIAWINPAAISYGTALSSIQLNARATYNAAAVAGSYTYSPTIGSSLSAGIQTLSVTFTPTDSTDYMTSTATVNITVDQATPALTWTTPAAISYGTALSAIQLNARATYNAAAVAGSYTYSPTIGSSLSAGTQTLSVTFTPTDSTNYMTSTATVNITVDQATPALTWTTPAAISYGTALSAIQLNASSGGVAGAFTYTPASGAILNAGTHQLAVTFAPTDNKDYRAATATTSLTIGTEAPTLSFATIAAQTYGNAPFTVSAASASSGAVTYSVISGPATISNSTVTLTGAGAITLSASQAASGNYAAATATTSFTAAAGFILAPSSESGSGTATTTPGGKATYSLALNPGSGSAYPGVLSLSATGLPAGATATFSPTTIPAGSTVTTVVLTIQTSSATASNGNPNSAGPMSPIALGLLLLPLVGMKQIRKRLRQLPHMPLVLAVALLSFGAMLSLNGCGGGSSGKPSQSAQTYTVVVTAKDLTTGAQSSIDLILTVQ